MKKGLKYVIVFLVLLSFKPVTAFLSPSTVQLLIASAGSLLWGLLVSFFITLVLILKKAKKKVKLKYVIVLVPIFGLLSGYSLYNYQYLKELNTYKPVDPNSLNMITYDQCVRNSYLDFLPKGNITVIYEEDMVDYLIDNNGKVNIVSLGHAEKVRFSNEIFVNQSIDEVEEAILKTANLSKTEPLFIHCHGGAHSSSVLAQFLSNKGFTNIFILQTTPEDVQKRMQSLGLDTKDYFILSGPGGPDPIVRVSLNSNLLKLTDTYYFYKVDNCQEYIDSYKSLTNNNTFCLDSFNPDVVRNFNKVHFLCDNDNDCSYLHTTLFLKRLRNIGYLVVLHE